MRQNLPVLISPLMGIMWWFDGDGVVQNNETISLLENDNSFKESIMKISTLPKLRNNKIIPY